jgi:hypothetical protein
MNTIIKAIQSVICYPFILVFFIFPIVSDISFPPLVQNIRNKGSGQLVSSVAFSYIYYLPNRAIEEESVSKYIIKSGFTKPIKLPRFYINYTLYEAFAFTLSRFVCYSFIVILISYIQGISVISIPLGGHAPPKLWNTLIEL